METQTINSNQDLISSIGEVNKMLHTLAEKNSETTKKYDSLIEKTRSDLSLEIANRIADIQKAKSTPSFESKGSDYKSTSDFIRKGIGADHNGNKNFVLEQKDMSVANHELGGYLVYPAYGDVALALQRLQSPIRNYAQIIPFSIGDGIVLPRWFNNSTSLFSAEGGNNSNNESNVGEVRIAANEITATHVVTSKLLEDAVYPIESLLVQELAREFAEKESNAFINGDGVAEPRGILTYGTQATEVTTIVKAFYTINSGAAATYTHAGLTNTWMGLKTAYAPNAKWYGSRSALAGIVALADSQLMPIYGNQSGINVSTSSGFTLFGKEFVVLEHMPTLAASSKSLMYGDMQAAYAIAEKPVQTILRNPFRSDNRVSFQGRKRVGGDVKAFDALVVVTTQV
jgi:HK97 family phage major capsid protein